MGWLLLLALTAPVRVDSPAISYPLTPSSRAELAGAEQAARLLGTEDGFVRAMSPFDRSARLKVNRQVSESEYLAFVAGEVRPWSVADRARLRPILESFRTRVAELALRMPPIVRFVKTTGREEGKAAYCRGPVVVLPENVLDGDPGKLATTVFHELFHVYSTGNPDRRRALYAAVGFEPCPEIPLPPSLAARKLTNPDAPRIDAFTRVEVGGEERAVTPVLLGRTDLYDTGAGGEFFEQMDFRLMVLEAEETAGRYRPAMEDGKPRLLVPSAVPGYLSRVGRNTQYIIHPEEILAENFVLLVDGARVPSPEILRRLRAALTGP